MFASIFSFQFQNALITNRNVQQKLNIWSARPTVHVYELWNDCIFIL